MAMFYLFGIAISASDAMDAAERIALGITGHRTTVPLSPAMQNAVCAALGDDPPDALKELRSRVRRTTLLTREW